MSQGLPKGLVELVLHNWPVMLYAVGVVVTAVRAYLGPTRSSVGLLYGFAFLAFAFEYQKHGLDPVRGAIAGTFVDSPAIREASEVALLQILPPLLYVAGLALVASSVATERRRAAPTGENESKAC